MERQVREEEEEEEEEDDDDDEEEEEDGEIGTNEEVATGNKSRAAHSISTPLCRRFVGELSKIFDAAHRGMSTQFLSLVFFCCVWFFVLFCSFLSRLAVLSPCP